MSPIIVATSNPSKLQQIQALMVDAPFSLISMADAGIEGEAVEDGTTLAENAEKKCSYVFQQKPGNWVVADDTGLFIRVLDGAPGIHAARWAGDGLSTDAITNYTLGRLQGLSDRHAVFRTVVVIMSPEGELFEFTGEIEGSILTAPRCPPQPKMPYSPIFLPRGHDKVWAEMTTAEENEISHRGQAFRAARAFLERRLR